MIKLRVVSHYILQKENSFVVEQIFYKEDSFYRTGEILFTTKFCDNIFSYYVTIDTVA